MRIFSVLLCLALTACGPRAPVSQASFPVAAANFTDADPHDWQRGGPARHSVHGIDLSRFQTLVDWPVARSNGVNFAFIKATEGGDQVDPMFATHWRDARRAGVPRGAYHFFYHCRPAIEQARWFITHVPREAGALPPVLDMEWTPLSPSCRTRRDAATIRAEALVFLDTVERHYGQRPIFYTAIDFFEDNALWKMPGTQFWLRATAAHPSDLYGGQTWDFWQYSSTGKVPGIKGKVDLNTFAGSTSQWNAWLAKNTRQFDVIAGY